MSLARAVFASIGGAVTPFLELVWPLNATRAERDWWRHRAEVLADAVKADPAGVDPAAGTDPVEVADPPHPPPPDTNETVELINEVLRVHRPDARALNRDGTECVYCGCGGALLVADWASWRTHTAIAIAERIEKAAPPAPFTFGDLIKAAQVVTAYSLSARTPEYKDELLALANRLSDAGHVDPNP